MPSWLKASSVPLFVSHRRLGSPRKPLQPAACDWALDSGGFSELSMHGAWRTTRTQYVDATLRYQAEIGRLAWCAPQDWMCEPFILAKTGLTVRDHQERTVQSFLDLRAAGLPVVPVLQGFSIAEYHSCVELYAKAGVDLHAAAVVGVGSVCRRQATREIGELFASLDQFGLRLHGFGVKAAGLQTYGRYLASADSMAWSFRARRDYQRRPSCTHKGSCANCPAFALWWRSCLLRSIGQHDGTPIASWPRTAPLVHADQLSWDAA